MFEKETSDIISKYKESLKLVKKLSAIYGPYAYGGEKRNDIFYLDVRVESPETIKHRAFNLLDNIMKSRNLKYNVKQKTELQEPEELAKLITKVTLQDFFNSITEYINNKDYQFLNNKYVECKSHISRHVRILEALQVLKTGEPIDNDTKNKIYKIDAGIFIFHGCKVQTFKNGKIIIEFSDLDFFKDFQKHFKAGEKIEIERRNEERKRWENS